ncbi:hypothetical protein [Niallia taxi]|uniref:Uncharacterized protein n=1 Tax=Niallia taxi TaxID=2499688 RepID=A0A437KH78_9BACI|nr:hypothetical protein [Niallia taxi]RVT67674.1 hypothetical protein EM808_04145 [Niallia taxi]
MAYTKAEQETSLVFDNETGEWNVYSTVPKHIRKLMTLGEMKVIETENDRPIAIQGVLKEKQVSMKKERIISEETKEKLRLNGLALHSKTN